MSNILKGLNEGRSYGRDSWDSNMPGYQGDYGGAENFGRRNREWDEDDRIDARLRAQHAQKQEYEKNGKFWLKFKDSQRHLPAGPFIGKQAANTAAIELLKQQPELKGNLVITAYGPDETQGVAEGVAETLSMDDAVKVLRHYGADNFKTTSNELHFYKNGRGLSVNLVWNDDATRSVTLSSLNSATRKLKGQGVMEEQLDELSNNTLASYKKKAGADATQADKRGDYARGNKRMSGIIKATKKEFDNDAKSVDEARYDSGDYYNARQGYEYGTRNPSVDSGAYEFDKEIQRNEPGGDRGRPKNIKGVSTSLPADAFGRTTGKIPAGKTGRIHSMMSNSDEIDEEKQRLDPSCWKGYKKQGTKMKGDTRVNNCVPVKKESAIMKGLVDEGWKEKLGAAALAGTMALGASGANARVVPGHDDTGINRLTGKPIATQQANDTAPAKAGAPSGYSKEWLQKAADPNRIGRYMISVEKAQELLKSMP